MWVTLLLALLCLPCGCCPAPTCSIRGRGAWARDGRVVWAGCVLATWLLLCTAFAFSLCEEDGCPLMNTKSSGWCGNRRFKDRGSKLSYGIVGTKPAALTNGQAYPALVHLCTWSLPHGMETNKLTVEFHNYPCPFLSLSRHTTRWSVQRRVRERTSYYAVAATLTSLSTISGSGMNRGMKDRPDLQGRNSQGFCRGGTRNGGLHCRGYSPVW